MKLLLILGHILPSKEPVEKSSSLAYQVPVFGNGIGHLSKSLIEIHQNLTAFDFFTLRLDNNRKLDAGQIVLQYQETSRFKSITHYSNVSVVFVALSEGFIKTQGISFQKPAFS